MIKFRLSLLLLPLLAVPLAGWSAAAVPVDSEGDSKATSEERAGVWSETVLDLADRIAIQKEGRIKPLATMAAFTMLRMNGKRTLKAGETKLGPTEWLLDCLFFPERARRYEVLRIEDRAVLDMLGLRTDGKKKRDWYSYQFVSSAEPKLMELWRTFGQIEDKQRTAIQGHLVRLAQNYSELGGLLHFMDFGRLRYAASDYPALAGVFPDDEVVTASQIMQQLPALFTRLQELQEQPENLSAAPDPESEAGQLLRVIRAIDHGVHEWSALPIFPPPDGQEQWLSPGTLAVQLFEHPGGLDAQIQEVARMERLLDLRDDPAAFEAEFAVLQGSLEDLAERRGEYDKIDMEVSYHEGQYFFRAQWLFVLGFVLTMVVALRPNNPWLYRLTRLFLLAPVLLAIYGIVVRCILRERPPVSTLYESIIFCTVVAATIGMLIEFINRKRVAQFMAALVGAAGLFLASWYEGMAGTDTMPQLQAVLDSNFWLSVHVTTIALGYAASGFLAAALGHVYVLGKLFGVRKNQPDFYRNTARMTYGVIAFGLLFSLVGTITGGVWANDSWGRFWGWDPKENGALMIVLGNLIIMHARASGTIRDFGVSMGAVALCPIVAFSWFHTNLLGVGLHAYGYNQHMHDLVWTIYWVEGAVLALGTVMYFMGRHKATTPAS